MNVDIWIEAQLKKAPTITPEQQSQAAHLLTVIPAKAA